MAVTASEARSEHARRTVDTEAPPAVSCSCRSGQALVLHPPMIQGLSAPSKCCDLRVDAGAA
jgi:hypothetical protein